MLITFGPGPIHLLGADGDALSAAQDDESFQTYTFAPGNVGVLELGALSDSAGGTVVNPTPWFGGANVTQRLQGGADTGTATCAISTAATKSSLLVGLSRGQYSNASPEAPSENLGNTLTATGAANVYVQFPASKTRFWLAAPNAGGSGQVVSAAWGDNGGSGDEMTIVAVEILDGGTGIHASSFIEDDVGPVDTNAITTTAPCWIVAFVWGVGPTGQQHTFTSPGWSRLAAASADGDPVGSYVQLCTMYTYEPAPVTGKTYTFTGIAAEGAQIYLFAFSDTTRDADASNTLGATTLSSDGTVSSSGVTGSASNTLGAVTDTATGTVAVQGAASNTLGAVTDTGAGAVAVQGSASDTLGSLTDAGVGSVAVQGAASDTLGALTDTSAGGVAVQGASATTLGPITDSGAGAVAVQGSASDTLGSVAGGGAGSTAVQGASADTLGSVTTSGSGAVDVQGAAAGTLGGVTGSGAGTVAVQGDGASTLGSLTDTGAGVVGTSGDASDTLGGLTGSGSGSTAVSGDASDTLGATTASGDGSVAVQGSASDTLGAVTTSADGTVEDAGAAHGDLSATLGGVSTDATGSVAVSGDLSQPLGGVGESGAGAVAISGDGSSTLGDVTPSPPDLPLLTGGGGGGGYWPTYKKEVKTRISHSSLEAHAATVTTWVVEGATEGTQSFVAGSRVQFIISFRRDGKDWDYDVSATVSDSRGEKSQVVRRVSRGVYYIEVKVVTGVMTVRFQTADGADSETTYLVVPAMGTRAKSGVSDPDARADGESWRSYYRRMGKGQR